MKSLEKELKDLNLHDDFLFSKVMEDPEICRRTLEVILNVKIEKIVLRPTIQKVVENRFGSKGIRMDVYVEDGKGTVYNMEMQTGVRKELPKRSRYYQGAVDLDLIRKGEPYQKLNRNLVIFICTYDPFGKGYYIYSFNNRCEQDLDMSLGDETQKIFLNTKGWLGDVSTALKEFLRYVEESTDEIAKQSSDFIKALHKRTIEVKENKEMEAEYMTQLMREREIYEEGREEGREEGIVILISLLSECGLDKQEIGLKLMEKYKLSKEEVKKYLNFK